jgi:hypothetical protein
MTDVERVIFLRKLCLHFDCVPFMSMMTWSPFMISQSTDLTELMPCHERSLKVFNCGMFVLGM